MVFSYILNRIGGYYNFRQKYLNTKSSFKKKFFRFTLKGFQHETNSYLPLSNTIKGPINFMHGLYGIFISGSATIGNNCTIYHQVTIGSNMLVDSKNLGSPIIGDNCLIGAGAKIIGNIKIGNNCRIGANAVVTADLPDNSIVFAGNQVIVQKDLLENKIYQFTNKGWGYRINGSFIKENNKEIIQKLSQSINYPENK